MSASSPAAQAWHAALASYNVELPASPAPVGEADGATEHVDMSASPHASPGWHAALASYNVELPASPAPVGEADRATEHAGMSASSHLSPGWHAALASYHAGLTAFPTMPEPASQTMEPPITDSGTDPPPHITLCKICQEASERQCHLCEDHFCPTHCRVTQYSDYLRCESCAGSEWDPDSDTWEEEERAAEDASRGSISIAEDDLGSISTAEDDQPW